MPLDINAAPAELAIATVDGESANTWKVTTKRGTQKGIGASVSGAGAWVTLNGKMSFEMHSLEVSKTYQQMKQSYDIGGGIGGFWSWLGLSSHASTHKSEIQQVFHEVTQHEKEHGKVHIDMGVTGLIPNVQVDASAYVLIMQVTDAQGNTYNMASSGDPKGDTGAQDSNGQQLPTQNNQSTITI